MITPELIKQLVEVKSGVPNLATRNNSEDIVFFRDIAIVLCRNYTKETQDGLAKLFGFKNRSNCSHVYKKFYSIKDAKWFASYKNIYDVCKMILDHKIELKRAEYLSVEFEEIN